jgi:hypothetical protein
LCPPYAEVAQSDTTPRSGIPGMLDLSSERAPMTKTRFTELIGCEQPLQESDGRCRDRARPR